MMESPGVCARVRLTLRVGHVVQQLNQISNLSIICTHNHSANDTG